MEIDHRHPVFRLDGKVAAVTGAGSGMGRAIALTLAAAGAAVLVGDIDETTGCATRDDIRAEGGRAAFVAIDVFRRSSLDAMMQAAVDEFGGLQLVANLGGPPTPTMPLLEVTDAQFDHAIDGHVRSVLHGCQAAAPHLLAGGGGAIVNMASMAVDIPAPGSGLYHLAKTGVVALTRVLAAELGPSGVRVNALAPGVTITNFTRRHFLGDDGEVDDARREEFISSHAARVPLRMVATAQDQAWLALYLLCDASRFVTGQVVRADGGWSMA